MPSPELLIMEDGETKGRRMYNDYHRAFGRTNRARVAAYAREAGRL
jgi:hypothetical protein